MLVCLLCVQPEIIELGEDPIDCQASGRFFHANCRAITAPLPILGASNHVRANGIQYNVAAEFKEIRILLDKDCLEATLEEMANAFMMAVEGLSVDSVELTHAARECRIDRFDKKVIMVGHQAIRMTEPIEAVADLMNKLKECDPIGVIEEDTLSFVSTPGDMVNGTRVLDP